MGIFVLRRGRQWRMPFSSRVVDLFHVIARNHGSQAVWVPAMQSLLTDCSDEASLRFSYEEWIAQAVQTIQAR